MKRDATFGHFIIREPLGEGGFSQVYRAYDRQRREVVALKLIDPTATQTADGRQRFLREIEAARRLRYRHIVPVYGAGIVDGRAFLAMRLMRGGTLENRLPPGRALSVVAAAQVMRHTARALDYALRLGVIHRDVKPSNIFYADGDRRIVCLGDFGLAKVRGLGTVTRQGQVIGSIYYMAPEQVRGLINMTARSDVYSLGVVLYEMLTGRMPFEGQSQANILHAIVHGDPPQPRQFSNAITPEMERVILRALNKDPDRRYATAGELAAAFQNTLPNGGQATTQRSGFWLAILGLLALLLLMLYLAN